MPPRGTRTAENAPEGALRAKKRPQNRRLCRAHGVRRQKNPAPARGLRRRKESDAGKQAADSRELSIRRTVPGGIDSTPSSGFAAPAAKAERQGGISTSRATLAQVLPGRLCPSYARGGGTWVLSAALLPQNENSEIFIFVFLPADKLSRFFACPRQGTLPKMGECA